MHYHTLNPRSSYDCRLRIDEVVVELGPANVAFLCASDSFWGVIHFFCNNEIYIWRPIYRPISPVKSDSAPILRLLAAQWQGPAIFWGHVPQKEVIHSKIVAHTFKEGMLNSRVFRFFTSDAFPPSRQPYYPSHLLRCRVRYPLHILTKNITTKSLL